MSRTQRRKISRRAYDRIIEKDRELAAKYSHDGGKVTFEPFTTAKKGEPTQWDVMEEHLKSLRDVVSVFSPALSMYMYLEYPDEDEDDGAEPKYVLTLGNLPMGCPNCGRPRLNFYPDLRLIDCEKCDWDSEGTT